MALTSPSITRSHFQRFPLICAGFTGNYYEPALEKTIRRASPNGRRNAKGTQTNDSKAFHPSANIEAVLPVVHLNNIMKHLLIFMMLLSSAGVALSEVDSISEIVSAVKHSTFAFHGGGFDFVPLGQRKKVIDQYCETLDDTKLLDLENELWMADDGFVAIGLIQIIGRSDTEHARGILKRYRLLLGTDIRRFDEVPPAAGRVGKATVINFLTKTEKQFR